MLGKPGNPKPMPIGEEDDSYLKPGMKDENESTHKIGRPTPVKAISNQKQKTAVNSSLLRAVRERRIAKPQKTSSTAGAAKKLDALRNAMVKKAK